MSAFTDISYLHSFQGHYVWKCVMAFNADAHNKYEDPNNNLFRETVERKTNRRTAFNTVTVLQFERCTYTASLERYCAGSCLV
jgi:hypothetical protein